MFMTTSSKFHLFVGSNSLQFLIFCLGFLAILGCDPSKRAKNSDNNKDLGQLPKNKSQTLDTIAWKDAPNPTPPIVIDVAKEPELPKEIIDDGTTTHLDRYKVSLLLPFYADQYNQLEGAMSEKSEMALNYYGGIRLALEELHKKDIKLDVAVIDTKGSIDEIKNILQRSDLYNTNVIIGPVRKKNIAPVYEFAKKNRKVLLSPIYPGSGVRDDNPYFIQVNPSLASHCKAITKHALDNHPAENIVLVSREKSSEKNRFAYFQNARAAYGKGSGDFREMVVAQPPSDYDKMDLAPYITQGGTSVFIVPSWSDPNFVYAFLRQLNLVKHSNKVVVYGMPQWMNYSQIDYEYFERCNVHLSTAEFIDRESNEARAFINQYFNNFGTIPTDDDFKGYDLMLFIGKMMDKHGTKFQTMIDRVEDKLLSTTFKFDPIMASGASSREDFTKLSKMENLHVNIIKFSGLRYLLAN